MIGALCAVAAAITVAWLTRPLWSQRGLALGVAVFVLGSAGAGYYAMGSWRTQRSIVEAAENPQAAQAQMIQGMVDRLAARLKDSPNDAEGWKKLGRSYSVLGRYADAVEAYGRANALTGHQDVETLLGEAESLALAKERVLEGRSRELLQRALTLAPDDPRVLWFVGLSAAQAGDGKTAARHWRRLLKHEMPENIRTDLQRRIEEIENLKPKSKEPS